MSRERSIKMSEAMLRDAKWLKTHNWDGTTRECAWCGVAFTEERQECDDPVCMNRQAADALDFHETQIDRHVSEHYAECAYHRDQLCDCEWEYDRRQRETDRVQERD